MTIDKFKMVPCCLALYFLDCSWGWKYFHDLCGLFFKVFFSFRSFFFGDSDFLKKFKKKQIKDINSLSFVMTLSSRLSLNFFLYTVFEFLHSKDIFNFLDKLSSNHILIIVCLYFLVVLLWLYYLIVNSFIQCIFISQVKNSKYFFK